MKAKIAMKRPGAILIVVFGTLLCVLEVVSLTQPKIGEISPIPPIQIGLYAAMLAVWTVWFFGFIKYAANKGYSGWVALCLCSSSLVGFITLLILPDIKTTAAQSEATPHIAAT